MDKNKIIILALIVVIAAILVGMAAMMMPNMNKTDTKLKFKSNSTLTEGDSLKVKLTDTNGTAISNQTVNITITGKNKATDYHSVVTNKKGVGTLKLDKSPGKYKVNITFDGNDKYNGCNATKKITIKEEEVVEAEPASTSDSSSYSSDYSSSSGSSSSYSVDNLPPSNDPYPETSREQIDENTVMQKYEDGYISYVDLRTGERSSGGFYK